jgi:hypothetical protein
MAVSMSLSRLRASGLEVLEAPYTAEGVPSEWAARRPVVSLGARPDYVVRDDAENMLLQLERNLLLLMESHGVLGPDRSFLISLTKRNDEVDDVDDVDGWVRVRLPEGPWNINELGPYDGEPDFITMSTEGRAVCGVSAEEWTTQIFCVDADLS